MPWCSIIAATFWRTWVARRSGGADIRNTLGRCERCRAVPGAGQLDDGRLVLKILVDASRTFEVSSGGIAIAGVQQGTGDDALVECETLNGCCDIEGTMLVSVCQATSWRPSRNRTSACTNEALAASTLIAGLPREGKDTLDAERRSLRGARAAEAPRIASGANGDGRIHQIESSARWPAVSVPAASAPDLRPPKCWRGRGAVLRSPCAAPRRVRSSRCPPTSCFRLCSRALSVCTFLTEAERSMVWSWAQRLERATGWPPVNRLGVDWPRPQAGRV